MHLDELADETKFRQLFSEAAKNYNRTRFAFTWSLETSLWQQFLKHYQMLLGAAENSSDYILLNSFLIKAVETGQLDWRKYGHSRNVSDTLGCILYEMNERGASLKRKMAYALVHDIGKFALDEQEIVASEPDDIDNLRVKHIIFGEITSMYFGLPDDLHSYITYHHDANPWAWGEGKLHESRPKKIDERLRILTYSDSMASMIEPWRPYNNHISVNEAQTILSRIPHYRGISLSRDYRDWLQTRMDAAAFIKLIEPCPHIDHL